MRRAAKAASKAATRTAETTTKSTTATHEASATTELLATETSTTAHETATATAKARWASEAIFSNLQDAAVPVITVELLDGDLCVIRVVESNDTGSLHTTIGSRVDVGTDDSTSVSCR
jgi:hypothetical protein